MKKLAAFLLGTLMAAGVIATTATPAEAKQRIIHHENSSYSAIRVYSGWNCTGTVGSVPRGRSSGWAVDSVYIGKGASLWRYRPSIHAPSTRWIRDGYAANAGMCINVGDKWENVFMSRRGPNL